MIEEKINLLSQEFAFSWGEVLQDYPVYRLDLTWPSVGTVDLITFSLRNKETLDAAEQRIVATSSAYLAVMAHECWSQFPSKPFIEAKVLGDEYPELTLQAREKAGSEEADISIPISSNVLEILQNPPSPLPVYLGFDRQHGVNENLLSSYALGLLIGRCPYGTGSWNTRQEIDCADDIVNALRFMAEGAAAYYNQVFPDEPLGNSPALYLHQFIFPPMLATNEPVPLALAMNGARKHFDSINGIKNQDIQRCALNLAKMPDNNISSIGISLAAATCNYKPPISLLACCQSKGESMIHLKPAINLARATFDEQSDWCRDIGEENLERARKVYKLEKKLGLMPMLTMSFESCTQPELLELATLLSWSHGLAAEKLIEESEEIKLSNPDVWFQSCYLEYRIHGIEAARAALQQKPDGLEQHPISHADALELQGLCMLQSDQPQAAQELFEKALSTYSEDTIRKHRIQNNLSWSLVLQEKIEEALSLVESVMKDSMFSLTACINAIQLHRINNNDSEASKIVEQLVDFVPHDRKVFLHCMDLALKKHQNAS